MQTSEEKTTLPESKLRDLLFLMMRIRRFEEKAAEMYTLSKIRGFLHLYIGEEAVAAGIISQLGPEDSIFSTYREHGHALARGLSSRSIMAEMYGMSEGCSKGRGGSMHLFDAEKKFYGGNAIVAGHLPMAAGMALASKKQGKTNITVCFFGEGALAEGEFHETMNLAALWQVPLLMVCENNRYAMGTALQFSHANQNLESRGKSYGIEAATVDGMDVVKVWEATKKALEYIRTTGKPFFLVCNTFRFRAHSMFDSELYREKSEVEAWKKSDPVAGLLKKLQGHFQFSEADLKELESACEKEVKEAVDFAEAGSPESPESLLQYVYSENLLVPNQKNT
jgi:pyruvate dehydrogenase E1 component alpha subunit/2-oxoisovalerate dehydrogenase E1 component